MTDTAWEDEVRSWDVGLTCFKVAEHTAALLSSGSFYSSELIEYMAGIINKKNPLVGRILRRFWDVTT